MIFLEMAPGNLQQTGWPTELIFGLLLGWFLLLPVTRIHFPYILLLLDTSQSGAEVLAERLRGRVANPMIECSKGPLAVTISIGLAGLHPGSLQQLISQSDLALYGAKHSGRNRVMAHAPIEVA